MKGGAMSARTNDDAATAARAPSDPITVLANRLSAQAVALCLDAALRAQETGR